MNHMREAMSALLTFYWNVSVVEFCEFYGEGLGKHLYDKYVYSCQSDVLRFFNILDDDNAETLVTMVTAVQDRQIWDDLERMVASVADEPVRITLANIITFERKAEQGDFIITFGGREGHMLWERFTACGRRLSGIWSGLDNHQRGRAVTMIKVVAEHLDRDEGSDVPF